MIINFHEIFTSCSWRNSNSKFTIKAGQLFSNCQHQLQQDHVCTHGILWRQHYITASKEYL